MPHRSGMVVHFIVSWYGPRVALYSQLSGKAKASKVSEAFSGISEKSTHIGLVDLLEPRESHSSWIVTIRPPLFINGTRRRLPKSQAAHQNKPYRIINESTHGNAHPQKWLPHKKHCWSMWCWPVSRIAFDGTAEHSRVAAFEWLSSVKPKSAPELVASFELTYEAATR